MEVTRQVGGTNKYTSRGWEVVKISAFFCEVTGRHYQYIFYINHPIFSGWWSLKMISCVYNLDRGYHSKLIQFGASRS